MKNNLCEKCGRECDFPCTALEYIYKLYEQCRNEERREILKELRALLNVMDAEVAYDLQELGEKLINKFHQLHFIKEFDIRIGYVKSNEAKKERGKIICAECIKLKSPYKAYLPCPQ